AYKRSVWAGKNEYPNVASLGELVCSFFEIIVDLLDPTRKKPLDHVWMDRAARWWIFHPPDYLSLAFDRPL
ncbi:hypothetical protein KRR38_31975, partial [Novosphingobium sp. G106]|uniref:hypothetical protein n=1 Tax=Novosphingobium sp. G106 TaxID=2849500 RepID=UPI001C2D5A07